MAYNLDANGKPIPTFIPTGSTIERYGGDSIMYYRPGENAKTSSPLNMQFGSEKGADYVDKAFAQALAEFNAGGSAAGTTGDNTSSLITKQSDIEKGAFVGPGGNILYTGKKKEPEQFFARNATGGLTEGRDGMTAQQTVEANAKRRAATIKAEEALTADTPQGGGQDISMVEGGQMVDGEFQANPNYQGTQDNQITNGKVASGQLPQGQQENLAQVPIQANPAEYVNINGAYFRQTAEGLAAVNEPNIIQGLKTGEIRSSASNKLPSGSTFTSVLSSNAGASAPQSAAQQNYEGLSTKFSLPPAPEGMQMFNEDPISTIKGLTTQILGQLGLGEANSLIKEVTGELEDLENDKDDEIRAINDDPWLTEGQRVRNIQKIEQKYEDRIGNRINRLQLLESTRDDAQQMAQYALGTAISLYDSERRFQADQIQQYYDQAQRSFENQISLQELALKSQPESLKPTSSMQEYMLAVEQGFNGTFLDFKAADSAAGRAPSSGSGGGGFLTPAQINSTVNSIAGAFDNEPTVKEYNTIKRNVDIYKSLGNSATDDIQRVYTFAKIADPNSAVKEGEYASIEKYAQALLQRQGLGIKRVFSPTGILTPEARNAMGQTLQTSLDVSQRAYDNVSAEYQRQIDDAYSGKPRTITSYAAPQTYGPVQPVNTFDEIVAQPSSGGGGFFSDFLTGLFGGK